MAKYPGKITTDHPQVHATLEGETYAVAFPYSKEAIALAKADLKAPKFDADRKVWRVKRRWHGSLPQVLEALARIALEADQAAADVLQAKADEDAKANEAGRAAIAEMEPFQGAVKLDVDDDTITVRAAYHPEMVALFKSLKGKFNGDWKFWTLPLSAGVSLAENRANIVSWHNETVEKNKQRRAEKAVKAATRQLFLSADRPAVGTVIKMRGEWRAIEGFGKGFRCDEDLPSAGNPHLLGHEGEMVCYGYTRAATDDEIAQAETADRAREEQEEAARQRREMISEARTVIKESGEIPDGWHEPRGEMIGRGPTIYGTGDWFVIGDEYIWYVQNNGMDGDDWSRNNVRTTGAGAIGYRVPFDEDLAEAIRWGHSE